MLKKNIFAKLYTYLSCLIIFLIPSNLFLKFSLQNAYVNGLLIDYLIPKLYASDIFVLILLILWSIEVIINRKKIIFKTSSFYLISLTVSLIAIRQIFTPHPLAAAWYLLKLVEIFLLGLFFSTHQKILQAPLIWWSIISTIFFQFSLAIWQFLTQKSLLGFKFFGEPNLSHSIGLMKDGWWHTGRVLPYATTAHPNILGGILAIFSLILIAQNKHKKMTLVTVLLAVVVTILTQSISAILTLLIGLFLIKVKKINHQYLIISGLLFFITVPVIIQFSSGILTNSDSINRRAYLQTAAIDMIADQSFLGVGLNQFTTQVEKYGQTQEIVRFVQPTHHVGLLWLAEAGILGVLFVFLLSTKLKLKKLILPLLILLPIATLDHYLLTQQSGLLLGIIAINFLKLEK